jgi:hypothetical protein
MICFELAGIEASDSSSLPARNPAGLTARATAPQRNEGDQVSTDLVRYAPPELARAPQAQKAEPSPRTP